MLATTVGLVALAETRIRDVLVGHDDGEMRSFPFLCEQTNAAHAEVMRFVLAQQRRMRAEEDGQGVVYLCGLYSIVIKVCPFCPYTLSFYQNYPLHLLLI